MLDAYFVPSQKRRFGSLFQGDFFLLKPWPEEGLVLMDIAIEGKGKEIPGALKLLKMIDLRGKIVIGDALHTQREASCTICAAGGNYI